MNIYDIAKLANVSTATVSRVLNNSGPISQKSREKVEAVIAREGFIPNAFAHNLNTKQSHTIGIICPVIADPNHAYPVAELNRLLRANGFEILLISTQSNAESKRPYFQSLIHRQVDVVTTFSCVKHFAPRNAGPHLLSRPAPAALADASKRSDRTHSRQSHGYSGSPVRQLNNSDPS